MYGYIYEGVYTYHPYNSLVPSIANIISKRFLHYDIIPDENSMFLSDYYIKPYKNETMKEYTNRVPSDHRLENKIWGGWLYMIIMFLPIFIISISGLKVEKITKKKIKYIIINIRKCMLHNFQ